MKEAKYKVGILTWHYYSNFGSRLQAFAMQVIIQKLGYEPILINYRNPEYGIIKSRQKIKNFIKMILGYTLGNVSIFKKKFAFNDYMFERRYLIQTKLFQRKDEVASVARECRKVVYGSDQIWAPNVYNDIYLGRGINIEKIAYAASICLKSIPKSLRESYIDLLGKYSKILVREESGKILLKNVCGLESDVVLDPTLMIERKIYEDMENPYFFSKEILNTDYCFCYFLNNNNDYKKTVEHFLRNKKIKTYGISLDSSNYEWISKIEGIGPREFLYLIHSAKYVFTDSYHGSIFSLLYHKEFYVFERFSEDDPVNQNERIYQLDRWFGINDRILKYPYRIKDNLNINYEYFEKRLKEERANSLELLKKALE